MKRLIFLAVSSILLFSAGCATKGFVKKQTEQLEARMTAMEQRMASVDNKVGQLAQDEASDKANIQKAMDTSNQAVQAANAAQTAAQRTDQAAQRTDESARKAEEANRQAEESAKQAEAAAKKTAKLFQLEQKK